MNEEENNDAKGEGDSSESSAEETKEESSQSDEGEQNSDVKKEIPFHEHPRWKEREASWEKRFEDQEKSFNTRLEEIGKTAMKQEMKADEIPKWFGGDKNQWEAFQSDFNIMLQQKEDKIYERVKSESTAKEKAVQEANQWFEESHHKLETDNGMKVDKNLLLETAMKYETIDSKGRWNYAAAFEIIKSQGLIAKDSSADRKKLAGATVKDSNKGGSVDKSYVSSEDFRTGKKERPW